MIDTLMTYIQENRDAVYSLFRRFQETGKSLMLRTDLWDEFKLFCAETENELLFDSPLAEAIAHTQEAALVAPWLYLDVRPRVAQWHYLCFHFESMTLQEVPASQFLSFKEGLVNSDPDDRILEIDLTPFERHFPKMTQTRSIGHGVEFLNRRFSSRLANDLAKGDELILSFLRVHGYGGMPFMINGSIKNMAGLQQALRNGMEYLEDQAGDATWNDVSANLQIMGFEPGWGRKVDRILDSFSLLADILEAPDHGALEQFFSRIPMIFNVVIVSPHGYFAQDKVLGLPDTGGQVVYILDQVRSLEKEMRARIHDQGLDIEPQIIILTRLLPEAGDTTCNQAEEKVNGTENVKIIRIPFRAKDGSVIPHWISRFEIWPYLERFSLEAEKEVMALLGRRPDLIIGNYSDGNLVATLISQRLGVTQCTIAHALEKTKYLYSALYWQEMEDQYHFSCQFTADLIAMNAADFIITSTYQEIAGSDNMVGQYESYSAFTMPGLQRVIRGINVFDPKFNIVSPGADADVYFPYSDKEKRLSGLHGELDDLVFGGGRAESRGILEDQDKPLIFSMARLDHIKNLTGLVEWYAHNGKLRELTNLLIIGGTVNPDHSSDNEEREQIMRMHTLFDEHGLDGQVRWLGVRLDKNLTGELYRYLADRRSAFIQPAFFEAFGLTVIEAMASGLPTFATRYGGPLEIIKDGVSGFHINPNHPDEAAEIITTFFERCQKEPEHWYALSEGAINRVQSHYTWKRYAKRLLSLTCIYGFWKYATNLDRQETNRYLEMLYHLQFRPLAAGLENSPED
ncbi:MAG: sucrose synthase [Thermodesulfobacteriota bacterium]